MPRWKRVIDIAASLVALPIMGVVMILLALPLLLTSRGPLFFRQERVGYRGRRFILYKFRTMRAGAETASHRTHFADLVRCNAPMQKLDAGDARLIPGGWLLRASGLDELPQILNVLRGEMSIVGPRPCIPYEYEQYSPRQRRRFEAVPGLTGLWQVSGKNRTTFEEMIRLDLRYADQRSLRLDLKIIFLTLPALLRQLFDSHLARRERSPITTSSHRPATPSGAPRLHA